VAEGKMNSSDHILQMMSELARILVPLRHFDRLSVRGAQQIAQPFMRQEQTVPRRPSCP
jgi:hypothetical protein